MVFSGFFLEDFEIKIEIFQHFKDFFKPIARRQNQPE